MKGLDMNNVNNVHKKKYKFVMDRNKKKIKAHRSLCERIIFFLPSLTTVKFNMEGLV